MIALLKSVEVRIPEGARGEGNMAVASGGHAVPTC